MAPEPDEQRDPYDPKEPVPDFQQVLSNPELLSALDLVLLELEKRLFRYAKVEPDLLERADGGLVLAARAKARLQPFSKRVNLSEKGALSIQSVRKA